MNSPHSEAAAPETVPADASLYIFDFCGTLFASNTTLDFLGYLNETGSAAYRLRFRAAWLAATVLRRCGVLAPPGYMAVRLYSIKGVRREALFRHAEAFVTGRLASRRRPDGFRLFEQTLAYSQATIIASYTLDCILKAFRKDYLSVAHHFGSTAAADAAGLCTGRYQHQLHRVGKSAVMLDAYGRETVQDACFVTDNRESDRDLLAIVKHPIVLPPVRRSACE